MFTFWLIRFHFVHKCGLPYKNQFVFITIRGKSISINYICPSKSKIALAAWRLLDFNAFASFTEGFHERSKLYNLLPTCMVIGEVKEHANVFNNRFYPEVDRKKILSVRLSGMFLWLAVISYALACSSWYCWCSDVSMQLSVSYFQIVIIWSIRIVRFSV